jgi:hypothetical protein
MKRPLKFQLSLVLEGQNGNSTVMGTTRLREFIVISEKAWKWTVP